MCRWNILLPVICIALLASCEGSPTGQRMTSTAENSSLNLYGIALAGAQTGWAVGQRESADGSLHAAALQLAGGVWHDVALPDFGDGTAFSAIALVDARDGWAVGKTPQGGLIVQLVDDRWTAQAAPIAHALNAIALDGSSDGWAVGDDGTIARLHAGIWSDIASPTSLSLQAVAVAPDHTAWIVGQDGVVLHQQGSGWPKTMVPGIKMLTGIAATDSADLWATGWQGKLIHGNNSNWTIIPTTHTWAILAIALMPQGGWVVGAGGLMMAFQNGMWDPGDCTTDQTLNALALITPREGWSVGDGGTILRLHDGKWSQPVPISA
jgi:hypothetical protein